MTFKLPPSLIDEVWDGFFKDFPGLDSKTAVRKYPPTDVLTEGKQLTVRLAVAGFDKDDLDVIFLRDILTISGTQSRKEESSDSFLFKGISTKSFTKSFSIPSRYEIDSVDFADGLLTVKLSRPEDIEPEDSGKIAIGFKKSAKLELLNETKE